MSIINILQSGAIFVVFVEIMK